MTYFQNVFTTDFRGTFPLADRSHTPLWKCPQNSGRSDERIIAWEEGPYDLSGVDGDSGEMEDLFINIAHNTGDFRNWVTFSVDLTTAAASASAVTPLEIIAALNADSTFMTYFTAELKKFPSGTDQINIVQKQPITRMRFYVSNGGPETEIRFNARAGVAELPSYFHRHIVWLFLTGSEQTQFVQDGHNVLLELDPQDAGGSSNVADDVISNAVDKNGVSLGLDPSTVQEDWQLLQENQSGLYIFKKQTVDSSDRVTEIIEYHAGSQAGDLGRKIEFTYTSTNTTPDQITEIPYILTSSDLVTP